MSGVLFLQTETNTRFPLAPYQQSSNYWENSQYQIQNQSFFEGRVLKNWWWVSQGCGGYYTLANPGNPLRYNTPRFAPPVSALAHSRGPGARQAAAHHLQSARVHTDKNWAKTQVFPFLWIEPAAKAIFVREFGVFGVRNGCQTGPLGVLWQFRRDSQSKKIRSSSSLPFFSFFFGLGRLNPIFEKHALGWHEWQSDSRSNQKWDWSVSILMIELAQPDFLNNRCSTAWMMEHFAVEIKTRVELIHPYCSKKIRVEAAQPDFWK